MNKTKKGIWTCILFLVLTMVNSAMADNAFFDLGNGTVVDFASDLIWQQGENSMMTWEAAILYCENLSDLGGKSDWRLPNCKELHSLVDYSKVHPAINQNFFPNAYSLGYWSSTTGASVYTGYAWRVRFSDGLVDRFNKNKTRYVRCVHGGH